MKVCSRPYLPFPPFNSLGHMQDMSAPTASHKVSELLVGWRGGDNEALGSLIPLVYAELRKLARGYLRQQRPDHTLQSAALVHEAYVRLAGKSSPDLQNRTHFFA